MKTDRFSDSIRRKLESIRPDFNDKDWTRLQATLQQATPSGSAPVSSAPAGNASLLTVATVGMVILLSLITWQYLKISKLEERVGQLSQYQTIRLAGPVAETAAPDAVTFPSNRGLASQRQQARSRPLNNPTHSGDAVARQPDTVYITRYVTLSVPARSIPNQLAYRQANPAPIAPANHTLADTQPDQRQFTPSATNSQRTDSVNTVLPAPTGTAEVPDNQPESTGLATRHPNEKTVVPSGVIQQNKKLNRRSNPVEMVLANSPAAVDGNPLVAPADVSGETNATDETVLQPAVSYALAAIHPVTTDPIDWSTGLARRVKFMRVKPVIATVVETIAPASESVPSVDARFRVGVGSDVGTKFWSVAVLGEVVINRHWVLSAGIAKSSTLLGRFATDKQFNTQTNRDFRREFARGLDPKRQIQNIDVHRAQLQIPLSLAYRLPVSRSWAILPTIGTFLNLDRTERVSFYYSDSPRQYDDAQFSDRRTAELIDTYTLGTQVEFQRRNWVVQAGPTAVIPLHSPRSQWGRDPLLTLRLRLLYQF